MEIFFVSIMLYKILATDLSLYERSILKWKNDWKISRQKTDQIGMLVSMNYYITLNMSNLIISLNLKIAVDIFNGLIL